MRRWWLLALLALVAGWLVYTTINRPRKFVWDVETEFLHNDDEPLGASLFDKMAQATLPNGYSCYSGDIVDLAGDGQRRSYLFLKKTLYLDSITFARLDSLVRKGDNVMFVTDKLLVDYVSVSQYGFSMETLRGERFSLDSLKAELSGSIVSNPDTIRYGQRTSLVSSRFISSYIDVSDRNVMVTSRGGVNDFTEYNVMLNGDTIVQKPSSVWEEIDYDSLSHSFSRMERHDMAMSVVKRLGKGKFIFVANPLLFTNYGILDKQTSQYIAFQMAQIAGKPVVRVTASTIDRSDSGSGKSLLYYMLDHRPLRWALAVIMAAVVLGMLFTARRRQRKIPLVTKPQNRTLEFVDILGTIYFRRHDNHDLLCKKYIYFRERLRRTLLLDINDTDDDTVARVLAQNTGLDEQSITAMLNRLHTLTADGMEVSNRQLSQCVNEINEITKRL